ncbi:MAG: V-type ATPase subunit [Candidatus Schekmanbacteria bacterium]|nr:V-type ATPase subunit [Candidatus Schekmanbacteria bacterium]
MFYMFEFGSTSLASDDYGYINARVRGLSSKLLRRDAYQRLMEKESVSGINKLLMETDYAEEVLEAKEELGENASQIVIFEKALELNFKKTLEKIKEIIVGEPRILFDLLLERWDLQNLKTVLRAKFTNVPFSLDALTFTGHLPDELWEKLAQQPDIAAFIKQLEIWNVKYAPQLKAVYAGEPDSKTLLKLERALDLAYYTQLLGFTDRWSSNYRLVNELVKKEIDMLNLLNSLRLLKAKVLPDEAEEYFVPGGEKLIIRDFQNIIACASLKNAMEYLNKHIYHEAIDKRGMLFEKVQDVAVFERSLEEQLVKWLARVYTQSVLGFGILLGYLRFKYVEFTNLRILGRCKEFGVPDEITWNELIMVR